MRIFNMRKDCVECFLLTYSLADFYSQPAPGLNTIYYEDYLYDNDYELLYRRSPQHGE
jgi:hypothetical protein